MSRRSFLLNSESNRCCSRIESQSWSSIWLLSMRDRLSCGMLAAEVGVEPTNPCRGTGGF